MLWVPNVAELQSLSVPICPQCWLSPICRPQMGMTLQKEVQDQHRSWGWREGGVEERGNLFTVFSSPRRRGPGSLLNVVSLGWRVGFLVSPTQLVHVELETW